MKDKDLEWLKEKVCQDLIKDNVLSVRDWEYATGVVCNDIDIYGKELELQKLKKLYTKLKQDDMNTVEELDKLYAKKTESHENG